MAVPSGVLLACQEWTTASCPLVKLSSVAELRQIISGMPIHKESFPGTSLVFTHGD